MTTSRSLCLITALILAVIATGCLHIAGLPAERFIYEDRLDIYTIDLDGQNGERILEKVETRSGADYHELLHDVYFQPSLAPDGRRFVCIRFRNYSPYRHNDPALNDLQSREIVIASLNGGSARMLYRVPQRESLAAAPPLRALSGPIWSRDGRNILFLDGNRLMSVREDGGDPQELAQLPAGTGAFEALEHSVTSYIRPSVEGGIIFALTGGPGGPHSAWRIDPVSSHVTRLWSGRLGRRVGSIEHVPAELDEETVAALFGSRELPVFGPRFSSNRRFYFFVKLDYGWISKVWIGGYDRESRREWVVKTLHRWLVVE
jgi:hypothetical protein